MNTWKRSRYKIGEHSINPVCISLIVFLFLMLVFYPWMYCSAFIFEYVSLIFTIALLTYMALYLSFTRHKLSAMEVSMIDLLFVWYLSFFSPHKSFPPPRGLDSAMSCRVGRVLNYALAYLFICKICQQICLCLIIWLLWQDCFMNTVN